MTLLWNSYLLGDAGLAANTCSALAHPSALGAIKAEKAKEA
jgi:hypothetical protein